MKKLALILAFLLIVPGAAFGLEMMNNDAMDEVTGQSGVAIVFDDIEMFINIEKMAWLDTGGYDSTSFYGSDAANTTDGGGAIAIENFQIDTLRVNAITNADTTGNTTTLYSPDASKIDLNYAYGTGHTSKLDFGSDAFNTVDYALNNYKNTNSFDESFAAKALTIDATNELPVTSQAFDNNTGGVAQRIGGVLIGLPTAEISIPEMVFTPTFYALDGQEAACFNHGANYGTIYMEGVTMTVLNGWMEISPLNH